jgi:hypothetical protein
MKVLFRLTVLMLVTLVLSSGAAFAATWKWVGSDDKVGFFSTQMTLDMNYSKTYLKIQRLTHQELHFGSKRYIRLGTPNK